MGTYISIIAPLVALVALGMGVTMALRHIGQRRAEKQAIQARLASILSNDRGEVVILALGIIAIIGCVAMVAGAAWPETGTFWSSWPW